MSSSPTTPTNLTDHQATITTNTNNLLPPPNPPSTTPSSASTLPRVYQKGNWTLQETLVLITAKRLDDERRSLPTTSSRPNTITNNLLLSPVPSSSSQCGGSGFRTAELRWKWVENYCWRNGCLRSQNQCNDKWDNLLRDYKKVRDYEAKIIPISDKDTKNATDSKNNVGSTNVSYWAMEKHQKKERNLPSNLLLEVFEALTDVISRRNAARGGGGGHYNVGLIDVGGSSNSTNACVELPVSLPQHTVPVTITSPVILTPGVIPSPPEVVNHVQSPSQTQVVPPPLKIQLPESYAPEETFGSSERSTESDRCKRRKKFRDLGSSVVKGTSMLSRALMACEEKREKRHIELMELEERRLKMESERTEVTKQGMVSLIAAVSNLSGAIHALITDNHHNRRHSSDDNDGDDANR